MATIQVTLITTFKNINTMTYNTLGTATPRKQFLEESYVLVMGFPISGVITDFAQNMMVKLANTGLVAPVAAVTDRPLGRVVSAWDGNDKGVVRVAVPFESVGCAFSDAGIDEGQILACSGFDATTGLPKFKVAVATNYASAICVKAATNGNIGEVGILRVPYLVP